jgi:hypothetical protein
MPKVPTEYGWLGSHHILHVDRERQSKETTMAQVESVRCLIRRNSQISRTAVFDLFWGAINFDQNSETSVIRVVRFSIGILWNECGTQLTHPCLQIGGEFEQQH